MNYFWAGYIAAAIVSAVAIALLMQVSVSTIDKIAALISYIF